MQTNITSGKKASPLKVLLYGTNGVGKSTFCAQSLSPVFLDLEGNVDHLEIPRQAVYSYKHVFEFLQYLLEEQHDFKTLVVDSLETLEQLFWNQIEKENNVKSIGDIAYGGGYLRAVEFFRYFKERLNELYLRKNMNIFLIGHDTTKTVNSPTLESFDRIELRIQSKAAGLLMDWCNAVLYATREVKVRKEAGSFGQVHTKTRDGDRIMYTEGNASFIAKNVFKLPTKLPLDWGVFKSEIEKFYQ